MPPLPCPRDLRSPYPNLNALVFIHRPGAYCIVRAYLILPWPPLPSHLPLSVYDDRAFPWTTIGSRIMSSCSLLRLAGRLVSTPRSDRRRIRPRVAVCSKRDRDRDGPGAGPAALTLHRTISTDELGDRRVIIVGDVHGCKTELTLLLELLRRG